MSASGLLPAGDPGADPASRLHALARRALAAAALAAASLPACATLFDDVAAKAAELGKTP